jgi:hypothetical protein
MDTRSKALTLLIIIGCTIAGFAVLMDLYAEQNSVTGKISSIAYYEEGLRTVTKVTFNDDTSIVFEGHLLLTIGDMVTIKYHKYGLLWELLGYGAINTVDVITKN